MNILLIHQYFLGKNESGGSRWNEISQIWTENGHQVTVLAGMVHYAKGQKSTEYQGKFFVKEKIHENLTVIRCHVSNAYNKNFIGRLWAYFSFAFSCTLAGLFKVRGKFQFVVATSPPLFIGIPAMIISWLKRIPLVFEVRDLWPESAIDTGVLTNKALINFAYKFEAKIYRYAKLINVLTPAFKETLIAKKGVNADKIIMMPNAADFRLSEQILGNFDAKKFKEEQGFQNFLCIIYVGAHGVANDLDAILNIASKTQELPIKWLFLGDGMLKPRLKQDVETQKLKNVHFFDSVPKEVVFKYICMADIGLSIVQKNETFKTVYSNKSFDYMSCQKPILMAIDGVSRQLVHEADCGLYIDQENVEDVRNQLVKVLNNQSWLTEKGMNGYLYAKNHFDREVVSKNYLLAIQEKLGLA